MALKRWLSYCLDLMRFTPTYFKYRRRTMIAHSVYVENLALAEFALKNPQLASGAIVECGTWKGGMAAGLIVAGGCNRRYYFFDSFEGLPPAQQIDGVAALHWQKDTSSPLYYDNCAASVDEFHDTIRMTGCPQEIVEVHKGFFEQTLPGFSPPPIAVLRLDADWYESTMICLEHFWDHVMAGGIILIDDYYAWEGCAKAVHAFLARRQAAERICQGPIGHVAYIIKQLPA